MGIKFKGVGFKYTKKDYVLKDVNLDIKSSNEFICLIGHTGSGKSTLLQHMNALVTQTEGSLEIFNREINIKKSKNKNLNEIRKNVGLVFQFPEYQLFEETILKDVMFGPKNFGVKEDVAKINAEEALLKVGIEKELFSKSPFSLSGGQKRRVTIASILVMDPKILILDEPTRGLDPKGRREILELFYQIHKEFNKTIVLITHNMDVVADFATRAIVMKNGKIKFDGEPTKLFKSDLIDLNLDKPQAMKISEEIKKKLKIDFGDVFTEKELVAKINNLKKV